MTIKLSLFMLDPVRAHELYIKEIAALNADIAKITESRNGLRNTLKGMNEKVKSQKSTITVISNKLSEERKLNQVWEN